MEQLEAPFEAPPNVTNWKDYREIDDPAFKKAIQSSTETDVEKVVEKPQFDIMESGTYKPKNLAAILFLADKYLKAGLAPSTFDTVGKLFIALQYCYRLNRTPETTLPYLYVLKGAVTAWGPLPLSLVRASGNLKYFREFCVDSEYNEICIANKNLDKDPFAGVFEYQREGEEIKQKTFSVRDAERAGLLSRDTYKKYPQDMLIARARARALRYDFADSLSGLAITPEQSLNEFQEKDVTPKSKELAAATSGSDKIEVKNVEVSP